MRKWTGLAAPVCLMLGSAIGGYGAAASPPEDLALVPPPVITNPGPEYWDNARRFQGIPGIERAGNGRLWALWYSGGQNEGPDNYVVLVTSGDDGHTWSKPQLVIDPPHPVRAFDPCIWHDPKGRLWVFWAQSYEWFDGRAGTWAIVAEDSGSEKPTWSKPRRICDGITMNKPTVLRSGEWLLPAALWSGKRHHPAVRDEERLSNVFVSTDEGKTWTRRGGANVPNRNCDEHMIIERTDGSLWMLVRTSKGIGESFSTDRGATWTPGEQAKVAHATARFYIRRLNSGNLLLVKHGPLDQRTQRLDLTAYLSDDDGKTWHGGLLLDKRLHVSYPDGVQAPDGTIYVIYDFERTQAKEILMAVFTEEDVAAGKPVSDKTKFRVLVNKATGKMPPKEPDPAKAAQPSAP